jgi:hypothetical protein
MEGECGQATIPVEYESYAEEFAGLSKGECSDHGYTQADGSKNIQVPVIGDITIALFSKSSELKAGSVDLYKIMAGECGQASVPTGYAQYAEEFAGLEKGDCSDNGYTLADGSKTIHVPVIGDITVALYS